MRKTIVSVIVAALLLTLTPLFSSTSGAAGDPSDVYVTHGLPLDGEGTKVDVYVNGGLLLDDFLFGETAGPFELPEATYDVEVRTPDGHTVLFEDDLFVPSGGNFSVVASFVNAAGTPGFNVFANDVSDTGKYFGRITLHHAAAAPEVDVLGGWFPFSRIFFPYSFREIVADAPNGAQAGFDLLPFYFDFIVRVSESKTPVLGIPAFKLQSDTLSNVYVVGSGADGTLQVITSSIEL